MDIKVIKTEDGSHSLYRADLKETYHSFHGALQESIYVYIKQGLHEVVSSSNRSPISILEIGFGTGLNVLLTIAEAMTNKKLIEITTLEPFPLPSEIISQLNYSQQLSLKYKVDIDFEHIFESIHNCPWEIPFQVINNVTFTKHRIQLQKFPVNAQFDLVYFDAFAPSKQPDLWEQHIFEHLFRLMENGALLVTYCAQGQFKRNLKDAGFDVETLKGPPGKMEMVRGRKC